MRLHLLTLGIALVASSIGFSDDMKSSSPESSLETRLRQLEARVRELEAEVKLLKKAQNLSIIFERLEAPGASSPLHLLDSSGAMRVDRKGIIRDLRERLIEYWGFDSAPVEGVR